MRRRMVKRLSIGSKIRLPRRLGFNESITFEYLGSAGNGHITAYGYRQELLAVHLKVVGNGNQILCHLPASLKVEVVWQ